jgi:L-threonylcarbamoyladenylate synthase
VDVIIDGGEADIGLESTIVKLDGDTLTLLRPGGITVDALRCVMDKVEISHAVLEKLAENERPLSPGMKYRHYAPAAPLVLLEGDEDKILGFLRKEQKTKKCVILCYSEEISSLSDCGIIDVGKENDLETQAHKLFFALREADKLSDIEVIYAHLPRRDGIGLALYNRMIRAAAHTIKHID